MSNHLAVATVTAALRTLLQDAVVADVPDADVSVTMARLDQQTKFKDSAVVNIFLYRVTPVGAWVHADLPTRRSTGDLAKRPLVGLSLHYLISFQGNDARLEPQRLLGSAVRALTARPVLGRSVLRKVVEAARAPHSETSYLAESDLAEQVETVKITPAAIDMEEMSKLWSAFPQTPYQLSIAYQAEVVLIEANSTVAPSLPVRRPGVDGGAAAAPLVVQVAPEGASAILVDGALVIHGSNFAAPGARVRLGDTTLEPTSVSATRIAVSLAAAPAGSLRAGPQGLQVVQPGPAEGGAGAPVSSNLAAFVLRPSLGRLPDGRADVRLLDAQREGEIVEGRLQARVRPAVAPQQRVTLHLHGYGPTSGRSYSFPAERRDAETDVVTFPARIRPGDYLVRVDVDGADSLLEVGPDPTQPGRERYVAPKAVLP